MVHCISSLHNLIWYKSAPIERPMTEYNITYPNQAPKFSSNLKIEYNRENSATIKLKLLYILF